MLTFIFVLLIPKIFFISLQCKTTRLPYRFSATKETGIAWFHIPDRALLPSYLFLILNVDANSPLKSPLGQVEEYTFKEIQLCYRATALLPGIAGICFVFLGQTAALLKVSPCLFVSKRNFILSCNECIVLVGCLIDKCIYDLERTNFTRIILA